MTSALTPRQRETVLLVAQGHPNKRIADRMGLTVAGVKQHLTDAYRRLGVRNRTQAALVILGEANREPA